MDEHDSTGAGGPLGALGLGVWILGLIIGFVVAVEYDPEAADYRAATERVIGTVDEIGDGHFTAVVDGSIVIVELAERDIDRFDPGDPVSLFVLPGRTEGARLEDDVPVTPRQGRDFIAPMVVLLLGAMAVSADPAILYPAAGRPS